MSAIKEKIELLVEKRHLIPDEFWVVEQTRKEGVIWLLSRQKPSVSQSYNFDEERIGISRDGKIIWGFDSGCSCPSPWENAEYSEAPTWKEFEVNAGAFDEGWEQEVEGDLKDFLLMVSDAPDPKEILRVANAEIRRYLIKRVGYENIKDAVQAEVLHKDGDNELLKFANGEMYVKVKDSSTRREYLLFVEGGHKTCRSAIAWTFGLSEAEYNPAIET